MLKAALLEMVGRPVAADSLAQHLNGAKAGRYQSNTGAQVEFL